MSTLVPPAEIVYPDSDGLPMSDNTLQFEWIVTLKGNLDLLFETREDIFVAGDNLIYPVEGNNMLRMAPNVYVAFGRPKGYRGSYQVWKESHIFPQIVFEVLSPSNTRREMARKKDFYEEYGAEEYYILDPDRVRLSGYRRVEDRLEPIAEMSDWVSPRMGIRFSVADDVEIYFPDGRLFLTFVELGRLQRDTAARLESQIGKTARAQLRADDAIRRADDEQRRADSEKERAALEQMRADHEQRLREAEQQLREAEQQLREAEQARAEKLAQKLRELGVDPDA